MRTLLTIVAILSVTALWTTGAAAQTGALTVYFDENWTIGAQDCPGFGILDTCYVVGTGFNAFVSGVNYKANYPASMTWLTDMDTPPVTIGNSLSGISLAWSGSGKNGYFSFLVNSVLFQWNCNDCSVQDDPIVITGNPFFDPLYPQWTDWPNNDLFTTTGMTSLVCATVPVEETTWGQIKSLYQE